MSEPLNSENKAGKANSPTSRKKQAYYDKAKSKDADENSEADPFGVEELLARKKAEQCSEQHPPAPEQQAPFTPNAASSLEDGNVCPPPSKSDPGGTSSKTQTENVPADLKQVKETQTQGTLSVSVGTVTTVQSEDKGRSGKVAKSS